MESEVVKLPDSAGLQLVKRLNNKSLSDFDAFSQTMEMYNDWISKVGHGVPDSRFFQTMILRSSATLGLRTISVILIDEDNVAANFSSSGYPKEAMKLLDVFTTMEEQLPSVDAMLTGKAVILTSRKEIEEYSSYLNAWVGHIPWLNSLMAFPLLSNGSLVGSVVWGFDSSQHIYGWERSLYEGLTMLIQKMIAATSAFESDAKVEVARNTTVSSSSESSNDLQNKYGMSARQITIARMIADGSTNREIAKELFFSESTARYETIKIYERLRVKNRAQAAALIHALG